MRQRNEGENEGGTKKSRGQDSSRGRNTGIGFGLIWDCMVLKLGWPWLGWTGVNCVGAAFASGVLVVCQFLFLKCRWSGCEFVWRWCVCVRRVNCFVVVVTRNLEKV